MVSAARRYRCDFNRAGQIVSSCCASIETDRDHDHFKNSTSCVIIIKSTAKLSIPSCFPHAETASYLLVPHRPAPPRLSRSESRAGLETRMSLSNMDLGPALRVSRPGRAQSLAVSSRLPTRPEQFDQLIES